MPNGRRINLRYPKFYIGLLFISLLGLSFVNSMRQVQAAPNQQTVPGPKHFAIVGDFGKDSQPEADVANLIKQWNPEFVLTVGDNNYVSGANSIDRAIGKYYHEYIYPYIGVFGAGANDNHFFPTIGNHDWDVDLHCSGGVCAGAYFDYFALPNNERYYDFVRGPVHFFIIDSDSREPDGITATSKQGNWLKAQLAAATEPWKLVFLHHPPYASASSGPRWPYATWGASAVLAGHEHTYERILQDGIPYFVDGTGGAGLSMCRAPIPGRQICYDGNYGALLVDASSTSLTFQFINRIGQLIDTYTLGAGNPPPATPTPGLTPTATPTPTPTATVNNTKGSISGLITAQGNGAALKNMSVTAYRQKGSKWSQTTQSKSDATGHYNLTKLTPGLYRLRFSDAKHLYATEYYTNAPTLNNGANLQVNGGSRLEGINAALASTKPVAASLANGQPSTSDAPPAYLFSGRIVDAITGQPLPDVMVTLYEVPDWQPQTSAADNRPDSCQSALSKDPAQRWDQAAPTNEGSWPIAEVDPDTTPTQDTFMANPTWTDDDGRFIWKVPTGCWYLTVAANGYAPTTSSVVGVTDEVTDLNMVLLPTSRIYLPMIER